MLRRGAGHRLDLEDLRRSILAGDRILWVVHRQQYIAASVILEFVRHPSGQLAIRVVSIAGREFWGWADQVQRLLLDLAEITGADSLEAVARPGLERWLRRLGWKTRAALMEHPVEVGRG